jgi:Fur family zinc uptake transcriptional regulator
MSQQCDHDHTDGPGLHGTDLNRSLVEAEARCAEEGERMTPPRRRILELLLTADGPVKAYDLISSFGEDGRAAKPPTVYRALDFLEKQGLAHRVESLNAYIACRRGAESHAAAFLICDCCGATREIEPIGAERLSLAAAAAGYTVRNLTMEARGLCGACAAH